MSIKPKTIDNLGIESSIQYAKNQKGLDSRLVQDSFWVPQKTEVSVTRPYIPSEYDQMFNPVRTVQWALFSAPPEYEVHVRNLFSFQLIPSLGDDEKNEARIEALEAAENGLREKKKKRSSPEQWHEDSQEEKERQTLLALFQCIQRLDRALALMNSRRNQYQRG